MKYYFQDVYLFISWLQRTLLLRPDIVLSDGLGGRHCLSSVEISVVVSLPFSSKM